MDTSFTHQRRAGGRWLLLIVPVVVAGFVVVLRLRRHESPNLKTIGTADLQRLASTNPSVPVLTTLFDRVLKSGDSAKTMQIAMDLVNKFPRDSAAHNTLGVALAAQGKVPEARREFTTAMKLDPRRVSPYVNLGHLAMRSGDTLRARVEYDRATAVDSGSSSAWRGLGDAYKAQGERDAANQAYEKAITLNPKDAVALTDLGTYKAEMSSGAEGRKHLLMAESLGYRSGKLYSGLAMAFADQPQSPADLKKALEYAAEAEKLGDESSLLFYAKALALQRLGRYQEAIVAYQQGISVSPDANGPWIGLSQCFRALGQMKNAEDSARIGERILNQRQLIGNLQHQIQTSPERHDLREQYAGIMMSNHQYLLAAEQYRYIAQHQSDNPKAWYRVAKAFDLGGRKDLSAMVRQRLKGGSLGQVSRSSESATDGQAH